MVLGMIEEKYGQNQTVNDTLVVLLLITQSPF